MGASQRRVQVRGRMGGQRGEALVLRVGLGRTAARAPPCRRVGYTRGRMLMRLTEWHLGTRAAPRPRFWAPQLLLLSLVPLARLSAFQCWAARHHRRCRCRRCSQCMQQCRAGPLWMPRLLRLDILALLGVHTRCKCGSSTRSSPHTCISCTSNPTRLSCLIRLSCPFSFRIHTTYLFQDTICLIIIPISCRAMRR